MRRELFTAINPFVRGARLGAYVTGAALGLSLLGAVVVLATQPGAADASVTVAADSPAVPPERSMKSRTFEVDRNLLEAAARHEPVPVGDLLFELSREAVAAAETATPEPPPPAAEPAAAAPPAPPAPPPAPPLVVGSDQLFAIVADYFPSQAEFAYSVVMCESGGNARAISPVGYYGLWQFDLATWQSVGGTGLPSNASVEEQMTRARMLYDRRGWQPWGCA